MSGAVVLLSGGMDSTLVLYEALARGEVRALGVDYGQRHAFEELWRAERIARNACVPFTRIEIVHAFPALLTSGAGDLADASSAVVPWRNTILAIHACEHALAWGAMEVWMGCCAADAAAFPDCRPEWASAMSALMDSTRRLGMRLVTPLIDRTKAQIVRRAHELGSGAWHAIGSSWSCYSPIDGSRCLTCSACISRARGFAEAGIPDPGAA